MILVTSWESWDSMIKIEILQEFLDYLESSAPDLLKTTRLEMWIIKGTV
jgi:hypothetical protein